MKNRKILIIDDDQYIRLLLQYLLERSYDIEVRENGHEALLYLQEGNIPDMIISDLDMRVMTGNAFLDNIKQSSFFNSIPLIVLSAKENSLERIECLKKGADDYMMKPFNPEELKIRMSNIFQRMNLAR